MFMSQHITVEAEIIFSAHILYFRALYYISVAAINPP